jgi:murein DD-endopeptidase MepM/ murein hydrolase activator NlpD
MKKTCFLFLSVIVFAIIINNCGGGGTENSNSGSSGVDNISMLTPYLNNSDISSINEAFSSTSSAPWGFQHNGVDFFPTGNNKPFQAVASGTVDEVNLWQNNISSNWQVNVRIKVNPTYIVEYAFEPFSTSQTDGNTQRANISVSVGQTVVQGDAIGNLFTVNPGAHVHFGLLQNSISICPETYFTVSAKDSVLGLIHKDHPTWNMCY